MNLFGYHSLPPSSDHTLVRRKKRVSYDLPPMALAPPTNNVVVYKSATSAHAPTPEIVNAPKPKPKQQDLQQEPPKRLMRLIEEILEWKKRVNSRLNKLGQENTIKEVLREVMVPLLREIKAVPPAPLSVLNPSPSSLVSLPPTLQVKTLIHGTVYSVPDRSSRVLQRIEPNTRIALCEPWTENEIGLWMRTVDGGWFQLWDRATNTLFAE